MKFCVAFAALILMALPALAQNQPQQSKPPQSAAQPAPAATTQHAPEQKIDPTKEADIRHLLEVTGAKELGAQAEAQMMAQMREQMKSDMAHLFSDSERSQKFMDTFFQRFQSRFNMDALLEQLIPIYDKYFTDQDIKSLIHFYETPVGQRALKAMPLVMHDSLTIGSQFGQKIAIDTLKEMAAEYPELKPLLEPEPAKP
jgi:uncharacterized protein